MNGQGPSGSGAPRFIKNWFGQWQSLLTEGIMMVVLGAAILLLPGFHILSVVIRLIGIERLIVGVIALIAARRPGGEWSTGRGVFNLVIGLILTVMPGFIVGFFLALVGFWAMAMGIGMLLAGAVLGPFWGTMRVMTAAVLIGFGLAAIFNPKGFIQFFVTILAVICIVVGIWMIGRSQRLHKEIEAWQKDAEGYTDYTVE